MEYKDYYKVMGLSKTASQDEIKQAYRKLARKYHPDVSKEANAEEHFKEVGEAYEVLKDPDKRKQYDSFGQYQKQAGPQGQHQGSHAYSSAGVSPDQAAEFEEFINSIFGQQRQQQRQGYSRQAYKEQGQDIHASLNVSLEDAYHGAEKTIQLQIPQVKADGRVEETLKAIKIKIPVGVRDKQTIRLRGQGEQVSGQTAGDLYIEIHINPHPLYRIEKNDIYMDLPIAPWEAALGAKIKVPTLNGSVQLTVPKLSQNGKSLRLKGKGMPGKDPGDFYVILKIVMPAVENSKLTALYEEMARIADFNPRANMEVSHG